MDQEMYQLIKKFKLHQKMVDILNEMIYTYRVNGNSFDNYIYPDTELKKFLTHNQDGDEVYGTVTIEARGNNDTVGISILVFIEDEDDPMNMEILLDVVNDFTINDLERAIGILKLHIPVLNKRQLQRG